MAWQDDFVCAQKMDQRQWPSTVCEAFVATPSLFKNREEYREQRGWHRRGGDGEGGEGDGGGSGEGDGGHGSGGERPEQRQEGGGQEEDDGQRQRGGYSSYYLHNNHTGSITGKTQGEQGKEEQGKGEVKRTLKFSFDEVRLVSRGVRAL